MTAVRNVCDGRTEIRIPLNCHPEQAEPEPSEGSATRRTFAFCVRWRCRSYHPHSCLSKPQFQWTVRNPQACHPERVTPEQSEGSATRRIYALCGWYQPSPSVWPPLPNML